MRKPRGKSCPVQERFWKYVEKTDSCWNWTSALTFDGYGEFFLNGQSVRAHRVSWELTIGAIPHGLHVCHHCDNRRCVRVDHLFLGTNAENVADKVRKGRQSTIRLFGEAHGGAKLTTQQVLEMRAASGTMKALAKRYGVSRASVCRIRKGTQWPHLAMV